jgi:hypothetical protein
MSFVMARTIVSGKGFIKLEYTLPKVVNILVLISKSRARSWALRFQASWYDCLVDMYHLLGVFRVLVATFLQSITLKNILDSSCSVLTM